MNEVAVGNAIQFSSSADSHNPQAAKIALANATVAHRILQCLLNGFFCGPMQLALRASESRGQLQNLPTAIPPGRSSFYSRHRTFSLIKK
jgi:hypothetical protein